MASDMLSSAEWGQLKLWLLEAQLKAGSPGAGPWSAEDWLWHWVIDDPKFMPLIEASEVWQGVDNFNACQWMIHWIESVDIGTGFDTSAGLCPWHQSGFLYTQI